MNRFERNLGFKGEAKLKYLDGEVQVLTPDDFVRAQSGTTGIPERLCRANMKKNTFVLAEMGRILQSLTRGLDLDDFLSLTVR